MEGRTHKDCGRSNVGCKTKRSPCFIGTPKFGPKNQQVNAAFHEGPALIGWGRGLLTPRPCPLASAPSLQEEVTRLAATPLGGRGRCPRWDEGPERCLFCPLDDRPGARPAPGCLLPRPLEHSGLHSGQWGPGGLCLHVSLFSRPPPTSSVPSPGPGPRWV